MSPPNGHANGPAEPDAATHATQAHPLHEQPTEFSGSYRFSLKEIKDFCAALENPFDPRVIDWRVTNTSKNGKPRGQVIPYADQRAYIDRLNQLFTPARWTRKYQVDTSASFERSKDQKTVVKVFVTCELSISGLGTHSATGEEWSDDENAVTSAEAQAFKRSCACFGLGRYLYYFEGVWIDLDDRKRPKQVPSLPAWATPDGWQEGLRPDITSSAIVSGGKAIGAAPMEPSQGKQSNSLVPQIEQMAKPLGRPLYRGILRTSARVWCPSRITDVAVQRKVLEQMQSAERGLGRLSAAIGKTGPGPVNDVLRSLKLRSLEMIDSLEVLKKVVLAIEASESSVR
jgi:hypothetical protein